jgi:hypothetical protein
VPLPVAKSTGELLRLPLIGLSSDRAGARVAVRTFRQRVERELLDKGGGGIAQASRVHTAATAMRKHMAAERLLAKAGHPGPGCALSVDQWIAVADRALKWKETVDRSLEKLGLDAKTGPRSWYDEWMDQERREEEKKLAERLQSASQAGERVAQGQNDQGMTEDAAEGQTDALPSATEGAEQ